MISAFHSAIPSLFIISELTSCGQNKKYPLTIGFQVGIETTAFTEGSKPKEVRR
jgi:hypothetical protein